MKILWGVVACALALLCGCVDTTTNITLKPDGSGTIDKTIVLSKHLAEFVLKSGMSGDAASVERSMLNENQLKGAAGQMGTGVSCVSVDKITAEKGNGYHVVYAFKDISKVKINTNPASDLNMPAGGAAAAPAQYLTFKFASGSPATLTVVAPKPADAKPTTPARQMSQADADKMYATMKPLYADLRILFTITVAGKIASTNAAYADGSTVTLTDMDFAKILADDATVKKLRAAQSQSMDQVRDIVKGVPGVKLETQDTVTVRFE
ncbi:MAG TPA: hypothetical protein VFH83_06890 [Spirochaetia bacterium]|nr:hypothetical protein [Spirochaetia bacterium]